MSVQLEQNKLDVIQKHRSNVFNWKGQFTPEFIEYLLDSYANDDSIVADPFSGSGTVLSEAIRKHMSCIGYEINPSAFFMSKFYEYAKFTESERFNLYNKFKTFIAPYFNEISASQMVYEDSSDYRTSYINLLNFSRNIAKNINAELMPFMVNVLILCEKEKKMTLCDALVKNISYIRDLLLSLPYTSNNVVVNLGDARNFGLQYSNCVDLVITSPPYINVFNYHQNYRGIIECFGYDIFHVAASEIGSNRKHRSNRFKTVVQYAIDMGHAILNTSKALKIGGKMIFVVGRVSKVRKTPFYNSRIIIDIVEAIPSLYIESINTRKFGNRYGEHIDEDIITIQKQTIDNDVDLEIFEQIGLNHIQNALSYADKSLENDLLAILNKNELITESPIY